MVQDFYKNRIITIQYLENVLQEKFGYAFTTLRLITFLPFDFFTVFWTYVCKVH